MAPPTKRQRRLVNLSFDENEDTIAPEKSRGLSGISNDNTWRSKLNSANHDRISNQILPARSGTKSKAGSRTRSIVSTQAVPLSSSDPQLRHRSEREHQGQKRNSLHDFFNTTNRVQPLKDRLQAQDITPNVDIEEEDLIEDDSLDEDLRRVADTQDNIRSTLDRRKGNLEHTSSQNGSACHERLMSVGQRFLKSDQYLGKDVGNRTETTLHKADLRPWAEKYAPTSLDELMVHKKKISDVQSWLGGSFHGSDRKRLLILKGPSGAGKTATVSTLAKAMDFDIAEWRNPITSDFSSESYLSMSSQFEDFLGRSGKFDSLTFIQGKAAANLVSPQVSAPKSQGAKRRIILLEEFPNTFMSNSSALSSFRSTILQHLAAFAPSNSVTPIILIITETPQTTTIASGDSFTAHRLLGTDILNHPSVNVIEYNPIAATYLMKALDLVVQKEARHSGRRRIPGPSVLERLGGVGDVRSAIGSLEFLCLRADDGDDWVGRVANRGKKGTKSASALTKMEKESLEMVTQREASLGLFHTVGKVIYNKRVEYPAIDDTTELPTQPPDYLPQHARLKASQVSAEELMNEMGTDARTFIAALHENYVLSCEGESFTDSVNDCIDILSDSDLLSLDRGSRSSDGMGGGLARGTPMDSLRQNEISFQFAVRGILFALPYPVKRRAPPSGMAGRSGGRSDAFRMFYPNSLRLSRLIEECESLVDQWTDRYRASIAVLVTGAEAAENSQHQYNDSHKDKAASRTGIFCTKTELILERLPYIAKIQHSNPTSSDMGELERITRFDGVQTLSDEVPDENSENSPMLKQAFEKTPRIGPAPPKLKTGSKRANQDGNDEGARAISQPESGIGKLYLSDDDIEDD